MLNIALFGPPGAGKGTQSEALVKEFNLCYISTGDLLRKELAADSKLGQQAKDIIAAGGLVSDEIIVQILEKTIEDNPHANGFLFDGFPRTSIQAYILEGLMIKLNTSLDCLINLDVPEEESVRRLLLRGKTSGRSDDNEVVIRNRLKEYHEKTLPVLDFYDEKGLRIDVDGTGDIEEVREEVTRIARAQYTKRPVGIVVFGYPGSGRGSQAEALAKEFGLEFLATGRMLGEEMKAGTERGKKVKALYESGQLVPDEIVIPLIEERLAASKDVRGFIFKGFPRTLVQSYILDGLMKKHGCTISRILEIEVPMLQLLERLDKRSQTEDCMPYDTSTEKIVRRLRDHEVKTVPVIEKYMQRHGVKKIDGTGSFEEVFEKCAAEVRTLFQVGGERK
ncbi:MAG: adenylate kinase [Verrucomicrobia bacterium]|nr:adenylate kinase [Verrucomicrobiota bacterium]MCH8511304.1 adenylate kinase [Kiritimatiellia bacterium]